MLVVHARSHAEPPSRSVMVVYSFLISLEIDIGFFGRNLTVLFHTFQYLLFWAFPRRVLLVLVYVMKGVNIPKDFEYSKLSSFQCS